MLFVRLITKFFVRYPHKYAIPKPRPKRGLKILKTEHRNEVPYPEELVKADPHSSHKFHLVTRIHGFVRRPWTEKLIVKELGLYKRLRPVALLNTPHINSQLWRIKHLVEVRPLQIDSEIPNDVNSIESFSVDSEKKWTFNSSPKQRASVDELKVNQVSKRWLASVPTSAFYYNYREDS